MYRAPREAVDAETVTGDDERYPPQSTLNQASQRISNFVDGSGPIFSMYLEMASEEDRKMVENWKAGAEGILIFTGLFSAAVATLISVSIQDIRLNPQDTSNFYLENIYKTVSDPNRSNTSSPLPTSPPKFSPPNHAVWVNSLWFLSLVISLTCALLATLLQQWARRYLQVTQPRYSPHKRARIRTFFAEGVEKFLLPWAVEALPALLHVSLFLFFAGLVVFLCNVNPTVFKLVLSWVSVCSALYGCITFVPILRHDSPYHTPLSLPVWHIVTGVSYVIFRVLRRLTLLDHFGIGTGDRFEYYRKLLAKGMQKTAEQTAFNSPLEIDARAFMWTFDCLDEDHELAHFFSCLPRFRSSKVVNDPLPSLTEEEKERLFTTLIELLDRTFSSDLLPEPIKDRRAIICAKALDPNEAPDAFRQIVHRILYNNRYNGLQTAEFGRIVRGWANSLSGSEGTALVVQAILTGIIAKSQRRDDSWLILASNELGIPENVLRDYAAHKDTQSFAILIHITRQQFSHSWNRSLPWVEFSKVLEAASKFDVRDTSTELQHEFCALWNQIVLEAQNYDDTMIAFYVLRRIHNIYITLHEDTNYAPSRFSASAGSWDDILSKPYSYPMCDVAGHIQDNSASTTSAGASLHDHDDTAPVPSSLSSSPDTPSSSAHPPLRADETLADVSALDNTISTPVSFQPVDQTTIESYRIPTTVPHPVTTHAAQGSNDTSEAIHVSTDPSASNPPAESKVSTSLPDTVAAPHTTHHRTPSDGQDVPSSPLLTPVLDDIHPTGPPLSSDSPATGSDHPSSPDSHSEVLSFATPHPSRLRLSSAHYLGAATDGEGSPKAALLRDEDVHYPSSSIRQDITTPDPPPQSPSQPPVIDVAVATPSQTPLDADDTGNYPLHPSHGRYGLV